MKDNISGIEWRIYRNKDLRRPYYRIDGGYTTDEFQVGLQILPGYVVTPNAIYWKGTKYEETPSSLKKLFPFMPGYVIVFNNGHVFRYVRSRGILSDWIDFGIYEAQKLSRKDFNELFRIDMSKTLEEIINLTEKLYSRQWPAEKVEKEITKLRKKLERKKLSNFQT